MNMVQFWIQDTFLKSDKGATRGGRGRGRCCCCGLCVTCLHPAGRAAGGGGVLRIGRASSAAVIDEDGHTRDQGDGVGGGGGGDRGDGEGDAVSRDSAPTPAYGLQRETCCDRYEDYVCVCVCVCVEISWCLLFIPIGTIGATGVC